MRVPLPQKNTPGQPVIPLGPYGERSPFEKAVRWRQDTKTPETGSSFTFLQDSVGTLTPSSLHYERHHAGIPTIDPRSFIAPTSQALPYDVNHPYPTEIEGVKMSTYMEWQKSSILISAIENPAMPCGLALAHAYEQGTEWRTRRPNSPA